MTPNILRTAIGMAIALCLAGCGGKASFSINGTIVGLQYPGLELSTNGMTVKPLPPASGATTTFAFPQTLSYGEVYNVVATAQPAHQTCLVTSFASPSGIFLTGPSDTAGRLAVINIGVSCGLNSYPIGGTITGLTSDGLVLINGSGDTFGPLTATATAFTFGGSVPYGVSYGVSVLTQPANDICSVSQNGTGVMGDAAVTNIAVTCVPKPVPPT